MKHLFTFAFAFTIIIVLGLAILALDVEYKSNKKDVLNWISSNGERVVTFDNRGLFDSGPYWFTKNTTYYKVVTDKHNVYWFKYNLFGREIQKEIPSGYEVIED